MITPEQYLELQETRRVIREEFLKTLVALLKDLAPRQMVEGDL